MSLRIGTNIASLSAQRYLSKNQRQMESSYQALASGSRLSTPQNDAAGFAISEILRGQAAGAKQAESNARAASAMLQTAEGSMNEQNNILVRLRELAVNSASDTIGDTERGFLDNEFQQLTQEFDRIAKVARFGSKELLSGSGEEFQFQVGSYAGEDNRISFKLDADTSASSVGIDGLAVDDQGNAESALSTIDEAVSMVAGNRAAFGAVQSRLSYAMDNLQVQHQNLDEARSIIADTDVAEETSKLARAQVLEQAGISVLASANQAPMSVLKLIN